MEIEKVIEIVDDADTLRKMCKDINKFIIRLIVRKIRKEYKLIIRFIMKEKVENVEHSSMQLITTY